MLVLVDFQSQEGDLMDSKFIHLYCILTRPHEENFLNTAMQELQAIINRECTIQLVRIGYLKERTFYVAYLAEWNMIFGKPALSAVNTQISASKKPFTMQPPNMQLLLLTIWQRLSTQASFWSAAIKIICKKETDYIDVNEDAIVIPSSKVEGQFNVVQEFRNVFLKTMPSEIPPPTNENHTINTKPESEWLPT